jgi:transposase InsO family protein
VERYNGTMAREWLRRRPYESEEDRTAALADFLNYYNHERPHSALGWVPPVARAPQPDGAQVEPQAPPQKALPEQLTIFDT